MKALKFKKNKFGEYVSGIYKIEKNEYTNMWSLYVFVDNKWEWSLEGTTLKEMKAEANIKNSENNESLTQKFKRIRK